MSIQKLLTCFFHGTQKGDCFEEYSCCPLPHFSELDKPNPNHKLSLKSEGNVNNTDIKGLLGTSY